MSIIDSTEVLSSGPRHCLSRRHGAQPGLRLSFVTASPSSSGLAALEREYNLRDRLDPDWAVAPVAWSSKAGQPELWLHDPGGDLLEPGPLQSVEDTLAAGLALTRALEAMHERGLLHLDLRPCNVVYDSAAGQAWLTNFSSTLDLREALSPPPVPPSGSPRWAYISPEQTGRTGQSIDARSDLYGVGVMLYQMLTGELPFQARDPMGWVHSHLAQMPVPPCQRSAGVPEMLGAIVMKLLAKAPEGRYQTARGLHHDLRLAQQQWARSGTIATFGMAVHDGASRLALAPNLYGREPQQAALGAAAERVLFKGGRELVLLSGPAGVGKTALGRELFQRLAGDGFLLALAKAERSQREVPYASLAQALNEAVRTCLGWPEAKLTRLCHQLRQAVGRNGGLLLGLVPELRQLLGEQPPAAELPARETTQRFHLTFQRFLEALAGFEQPLALLLDDLQWVDEATLELLESLLASDGVEHLLLVFTWRDDQTDWPSRLEGWRARLTCLPLAPLTRDDLTALLADSLNCRTGQVVELAGLLLEKTGGNPLHGSQFLRSLEDEGWLQFDHTLSHWCWNLPAIRSRNFSDNVVGLMLERLELLGEATRSAMVELALLGRSCSASRLNFSSGVPERELHQALSEAVAAGLVRFEDGSYSFLHDRVQEASYARLRGSARELAHLRIGRRLAGRVEAMDDDSVFEIVHHYNLGRHYLDCPDERHRLSLLNLRAANRAKREAAHAVAASCLWAARELLPENAWVEQREMAFAIELSLAENEYLSGAGVPAEERLEALLPRARGARELADVACARIHVLVTSSRNGEAVQVALEYLAWHGVSWTTSPDQTTVKAEYDQLIDRLEGREIASVLQLALATDPEVLALTDVLALAASPAFFVDKGLFALVVLHTAVLGLKYGNSDGSAYAFSNLGLVLGPRFGDDSAGLEFGQLSVGLVDKFGLERFKTRSYVGCAGNVLHWVEPYQAGEALLGRAFEAAMSVADRTYASYCGFLIVAYQLARGTALEQVEEKAREAYEFAAAAGMSLVLEYLSAQRALVASLRGEHGSMGSLHGRHLQEPGYRDNLGSRPLAQVASWYWVRQLQALVYAGDYAEAVVAAREAEGLSGLSLLFVEDGERHFFSGLAYAGRCDQLGGEDREEAVRHTLSHLRFLAGRAERCPENFSAKVALLSAELARLEGAFDDAAVHYDVAIGQALEHGLEHHAALACELAGRHFWRGGRPILAMAYLRQAREGYHRWGAWGLVCRLDESYPQLRREVALSPTLLGSAPFDLAAVVEASQALSSEIRLEGLMESLMRTALQSAGAARGVLVMESEGALRVEAEAWADGGGVRVSLVGTELDGGGLPESVVRYVSRSGQSVILDDAANASSFSGDRYIAHHRCRSVLCLPLGQRGSGNGSSGLLYLENNLAAHVFTPGHLAVLTMLASQAAISLENARLYDKLNKEVQERRKAEEELNSRLRFWALRSDISAGFSCVPCFELDPRIDDALATIGEFFAVDTAAICWLPEQGEDLMVSHLWSRPGTPTPPRRVDASPFLSSLAALRRGHEVQVSSSSLMANRGECSALQKMGVAAVLRLPMLVDGLAVAFLSLARNGCERGWSDGEVEKIRLVGEVFGHALARVRATRDLERTESALAHVTRVTALGELAASIAHEVNQPLTAIVADAAAGLNWLLRETPDLGAVEESLQAIARDGERGGEVLKRIVAMLTRTRFEPLRCSVGDLLGAVLPLVRNQLAGDEVTLDVEFDERLPEVECDPVGIHQVLLNLLLNASEACRGVSSERRRIVLRAGLLQEERIRLEVEDEGVGLGGLPVERLFETFYTTREGGLGMGLAISRSIVERHGGRLQAGSGPQGVGARFHFCLAVAP